MLKRFSAKEETQRNATVKISIGNKAAIVYSVLGRGPVSVLATGGARSGTLRIFRCINMLKANTATSINVDLGPLLVTPLRNWSYEHTHIWLEMSFWEYGPCVWQTRKYFWFPDYYHKSEGIPGVNDKVIGLALIA